jgi:hypothetical protein
MAFDISRSREAFASKVEYLKQIIKERARSISNSPEPGPVPGAGQGQGFVRGLGMDHEYSLS